MRQFTENMLNQATKSLKNIRNLLEGNRPAWAKDTEEIRNVLAMEQINATYAVAMALCEINESLVDIRKGM